MDPPWVINTPHLHPRNASLTLPKMLTLFQLNFDLQNHSGPFTQPLSGFCSPPRADGWGTLGFPPWGCRSILGIPQLSLPWALAGLEHSTPHVTSRASSPPPWASGPLRGCHGLSQASLRDLYMLRM